MVLSDMSRPWLLSASTRGDWTPHKQGMKGPSKRIFLLPMIWTNWALLHMKRYIGTMEGNRNEHGVHAGLFNPPLRPHDY